MVFRISHPQSRFAGIYIFGFQFYFAEPLFLQERVKLASYEMTPSHLCLHTDKRKERTGSGLNLLRT
jgi:hypothetical protein